MDLYQGNVQVLRQRVFQPPPRLTRSTKSLTPPYLTEIILEQELLEKKSKYALLQHASWADK